MKKTLIAAAALLSGQVMAGSITIQELTISSDTGVQPVCFNGEGKLLPCYDQNPVPPTDDPYAGSWSGTMTYDRNSASTCYDADITMRVNNNVGGDMIVYPDGGKTDILPTSFGIPSDGFVYFISNEYDWHCDTDSSSFCPFDNSPTDFTLQFTINGSASGVWNEQASSGCYGTWEFTKD